MYWVMDPTTSIQFSLTLFKISANCFRNSEPEGNFLWNALSCSLCSSVACGPGIIYILTLSSSSRRDVIWVAWRVQRLWSLGNGIPLRLSSTEDLPELWSPTTTSYIIVSLLAIIWEFMSLDHTCGRGTCWPMFKSRSLSTLSSNAGLDKIMTSRLMVIFGAFKGDWWMLY